MIGEVLKAADHAASLTRQLTGIQPAPGPSAAQDLLEVFVRRHENASTIVTTNRPTQDWGVFLGDVPAATAILDRFLSRAQIIQLQGRSYRLHQQRVKQTEEVSA